MSTVGVLGIFFALATVIKRYSDGTYDNVPTRNDVSLFSFSTFGNCFPILVGAFGAHYNIPALYKEVAPAAGSPDWDRTPEGRAAFHKMMKVILISLIVSSIVYGACGLVVYATFGYEISNPAYGDFTKIYYAHDGWLVVVRLTMTLAICASFPLSMVALRNACFNIALHPRGVENTTFVRITLTTVLTGTCLGVGLAVGNLSKVLDLNGSIFGTPVCYVAPAAMYLFLPRREERKGGSCRLFSRVCVILGVVFGLLGVYVQAKKW